MAMRICTKIAALRDGMTAALLYSKQFKKTMLPHVALCVNPADFVEAYKEMYPADANRPVIDIIRDNPYLVIAGVCVYPSAQRERL